jgi:uncharacterized membrane protein
MTWHSLVDKTPLVWLTQSYWRDEAFSVLLAQQPIDKIVTITAGDFSPPAYYITLKIWAMLFGYHEIATRSLSLFVWVIHFITIAIYMIRGRVSLVNKLFALSFSTFSPILIYYAFETRMYSIVALFSTISWISLVSNKKKLFVVATLISIYTHYSNVFTFIAQLIYVFILRKINRSNETRRSLFEEIFPFTLIAILYLPWIIFVVISHSNNPNATDFWVSEPTIKSLFYLPGILMTGYEKGLKIDFDIANHSSVIWLLILLMVIVIYKDKLKTSATKRLLASCIWFIFPGIIVLATSLLGTSIFLPRYLIVATPAISLMVYHLLESNKKTYLNMLIYFLLIAILYQSAVFQKAQIRQRRKYDLSSLYNSINQKSSADDYLLLESELDFHLAQYYFNNKNKVFVIGKEYKDLPDYIGKSFIPSNQVVKTIRQFGKIDGFILDAKGHVSKIND